MGSVQLTTDDVSNWLAVTYTFPGQPIVGGVVSIILKKTLQAIKPVLFLYVNEIGGERRLSHSLSNLPLSDVLGKVLSFENDSHQWFLDSLRHKHITSLTRGRGWRTSSPSPPKAPHSVGL